MINVKVIGAGSIGNHLTHACRNAGWVVTLCDRDIDALQRTRDDIYPARYGAWDDAIRTVDCVAVQHEPFDLVIIGTPPDTHLTVALDQLRAAPPRVMLVEKPLCPPDLAGAVQLQQEAAQAGCTVVVGYNHTLTENTRRAEAWLHDAKPGKPLALHAITLEHWGGILRAHPWLKGPSDTYLGHTARGGGAIGEHSHALNIWQHFAHLCGQGRVVEVRAMLDFVEADGASYDCSAFLQLRTEQGLTGTVAQDVVTEPARKMLSLSLDQGYLEWQVNADAGHDALRYRARDEPLQEERIAKTRPDDFAPEIRHLGELLETPALTSPISLERGLDTMLVIAAALKSDREGRPVTIDYAAGYDLGALR